MAVSRDEHERCATWIATTNDGNEGAMRSRVLLLLLCGCAGVPARGSDPCAAPMADESWAVDDAAHAGFDADRLCALTSSLADSKTNVHALLIARHGALVSELYRTGPDTPLGTTFAQRIAFDAQTLHDDRSVSKSVVGLLVGIEVAKGVFPPLDTPVGPALGVDFASSRDVTFRDLADMSTGLEWKEWGVGWPNDENALTTTPDPVRCVLDRPLVGTRGVSFNYSGGNTSVLMLALERFSGRPFLELVDESLFQPLGITHWEWLRDDRGRPQPFAGLRLTPRDAAKVAQLVLSRGRWQGRQLVPEQWVSEIFESRLDTKTSVFSIHHETVTYGHQWWTAEVPFRGRTVKVAQAVGNGGQRLVVVPELDLVIVVNAGDYKSLEIHAAVNELVAAVLDALTS